MVFCQQCGAENTDDARFCNMCGSSIAAAGEPGGPLAEAKAVAAATLHGHDLPAADKSGGDAKRSKKKKAKKPPAATVHGHADPVVEGESADATAPVSAAIAPPRKAARDVPSPAKPSPAGPVSEPPSRAGAAVVSSDAALRDAPSPLSASQGGFDVSTMSLQAIGVRSAGTAWATILAVVLLLVGAGAGGAWFLMRGEAESEPVPETEEFEPLDPSDEVVLGDPVPGDETIPEVVQGHVEPQPSTRRGRRAQSSRRGTSATASASSGNTGSGNTGSDTTGNTGSDTTGNTGSGNTGSGNTGSGNTGSDTTGTTGSGNTGSGSTGSGNTGSDTTGTEGSGTTGSGTTGSDTTGTEGSETGGTGSGRDWGELAEDLPEERDLEMELYASRIRSFIRSYYIRRASSCFDHASRNAQEMLRGTVVVGFQIAASGEVSDTSVARNTTNDPAVAACLARQVDSWRLPAPPDGRAPLAMQMPFSQ